MVQVSIDRHKLEAALCRKSFADFVQRFWDVIIPEPLVWNWHMRVLCEELQTAAERVFQAEKREYDIVINVPPGTSKSSICSVMFPAWIWTRMPSARCLSASYAEKLAMDLSRRSRDVIESDKFTQLYGGLKLRDDQNAKSYFINEAGGDRFAVGTNGTVTGFHGHFIIIDDPINPMGAASQAELASANRWVTETLKTRKVNKAVTLTVLIMQRLHEKDPTAIMLEKAAGGGVPIRHLCLPAEISSRDDVRPRKLAKFYREGLLDPVRMPREVLKEALVEHGQYGYAGQFLQKPTPPQGGMFKVNRFQVDDPPTEFRQVVRYWDKAGTQDGGAFTAGVKIGLDLKGRYWVLDVVRGQWEASQREDQIELTAGLDTVAVEIGVEQEPGSGGKESAEATMKRLAGYRVRADRVTGNKALRADTFSVQVNAGNVSLVKGAPWVETFVQEFQFFPRSKFKDQVDASSGAFSLLTKRRTVIGALPKAGPILR
jgi:predicted phage terminase large subunit-like protein